MVNNILADTTKPELVQYFHAALFIPATKKPPQGNQARFPQYMSGTHRCIDQEESIKINKHNSGTPAHETIGTVINQEDNYIHRPKVKLAKPM